MSEKKTLAGPILHHLPALDAWLPPGAWDDWNPLAGHVARVLRVIGAVLAILSLLAAGSWPASIQCLHGRAAGRPDVADIVLVDAFLDAA